MSTQTPRLSGSTAESRRQARASARYRLGQVTPASQLATSRCRDLFFNRLVKEHCEPPCIAPGSLHASDGYRLSAGRTRHPRRGIWLQKASMRRHTCRFIAKLRGARSIYRYSQCKCHTIVQGGAALALRRRELAHAPHMCSFIEVAQSIVSRFIYDGSFFCSCEHNLRSPDDRTTILKLSQRVLADGISVWEASLIQTRVRSHVDPNRSNSAPPRRLGMWLSSRLKRDGVNDSANGVVVYLWWCDSRACHQRGGPPQRPYHRS